jgi:uncharacterized membrane protein YfcA
MIWLAAYLALGAAVGLLAGLFGIGGGLLLVPALTFLFEAQHLAPGHELHLALGTAMGSIVFTAIGSARTHHQHGAVNFDLVKGMTPGLLLGTALGAMLAKIIPTRELTLFFVLFVCLTAVQTWFGKRPHGGRPLPGRIAQTVSGTVIGAISSLVSIGGGTLSVPYLMWHHVPLRHAIGTSAALGFPIAIGGSLGYMIIGHGASGLPEWAVGYLYLPALASLVASSYFTTPIGARLAHRAPLALLRKLFALLLLAVALKMLLRALG